MNKLVALLAAMLLVNQGNAAVRQYAPRPQALLDLQTPPGAGPFPLFIAVHGGNWESGTREDAVPFCRVVLAEGFACAAIDYRLAPAARFPAPVEDVHDALLFLRTHAPELSLDPLRFFLAGESAGGHLAAIAALRYGQVAGAVLFATPFDLTALSEPGRFLDIIPTQVSQLLDIHRWTPASIAAMESASPLSLLHRGAPPFLVIRGVVDGLVPAAQSEAFCEKARTLDVPCQILSIPQAKHALWSETELARFETMWSRALVEWTGNLPGKNQNK